MLLIAPCGAQFSAIILNLFEHVEAMLKQPPPRRAAYCIPLSPLPPQLFVFKIATNLSTYASSYFT